MGRKQLWSSSLESVANNHYNLRNLVLFFPLFHLPSFLVGIALGSIFLKNQHNSVGMNRIIFRASILLLVLILAARTKLPDVIYTLPFMVLLYSVLIYSGARTVRLPGILLTHPALVLLGDASYAMYILQAPLSSWFEYSLKLLFRIREWTYDARLVFIFFLILVVASIVSHKFVEQPCRRRIIKWFEKRDKTFVQPQLSCSIT
jgi:peptidoglycan/LPS O-acetylase OafA/YrhL